MKRLFALGIIAALLTQVLPGVAAEEEKAGPNDNKPPEGFVALFNGNDLTNWQAAISIDRRLKLEGDALATAQKEADAKVLPHWKAENGLLVNDGRGGNLATAKDYGNFDLYVDWKIEPKGDSGIYLRGIPQVQIWDSDSLNPKTYTLERGKGSGALWNNRAKKDKVPLKKADKAPGQWNRFHIVMRGEKVKVELNGVLVVDDVTLDNLFAPGKPVPAKGPIELQQHPKQDGTLGLIQFKNVYIKELPD